MLNKEIMYGYNSAFDPQTQENKYREVSAVGIQLSSADNYFVSNWKEEKNLDRFQCVISQMKEGKFLSKIITYYYYLYQGIWLRQNVCVFDIVSPAILWRMLPAHYFKIAAEELKLQFPGFRNVNRMK